MKKLILIFFILVGCEQNTMFPEYGEFGKNILYDKAVNFDGSYRTDKAWYSLTTHIPIRVVIDSVSGLWYIGRDDQWEYTKFNGSQEFTSDGFADKRIFFKESGSAIIRCYKHNKLILEKQIYWNYLF